MAPREDDYSVDNLILICEYALKSGNRNFHLKEVASVWALLKCGCDFVVVPPEDGMKWIWLKIFPPGSESSEHFFIPTAFQVEKMKS